MIVRVYNYNCDNVIAKTLPDQVEQDARDLTEFIIQGIQSSSFALEMQMGNAFLNHIAQIHCDKWVEDTAGHMFYYASAQQKNKPKLATPSAIPAGVPGSVQDQIVHYKSFSGDVSGVIGEAVLAYILQQSFNLSEDDFVHLRGDKNTGFFPDFSILQITPSLENALNWDGNSIIHSYVPVEVKAVTHLNRTTIWPKIMKAILQIQSFWNYVGSCGASMICIAIRNQNMRSYDVALLWIR